MSLTILAVDDSRTMRDMLSFALKAAGFDVAVAEDGVHGLEMLGTMKPNVIITDMNMPRLDGLGFIQRVRRDDNFRTIPILVLTTENGAELKSKARSAGATGWIVKPFDRDKLVTAIHRIAG